MAGVQTMKIKNINPSMEDALIIAVIIMKQAPKIFQSKSKLNETRGVMNLSLRDSPNDVINCTIWGSEPFVTNYDRIFQIGNVVNVVKPRIVIRSLDRSESFQPKSTSSFSLTVNEGVGEIVIHEGGNYAAYMNLIHYPLAQDYLAISNILQKTQGIQDDNVNLLVAVREVKPIKEIKSRNGAAMQCRDVIVMDQTSPNFLIQIWEKTFIERASQWRPRDTILYISDLRVRYSAFHRSAIGSFISRTVITEEPRGIQLNALKEYAKSQPVNDQAMAEMLISNADIDPSTINTVMSLAQISDRAIGIEQGSGGIISEDMRDSASQEFTALVFAMITHLDLDGYLSIITTKCGRCRFRVSDGGLCSNQKCPVGSGEQPSAGTVTAFDLRVHVTDHTCTLTNLRLNGAPAEKMLGCTVAQFEQMAPEQRTALKWNFLMERCAIRLLVMKVTATRLQPIVTILECTLANPAEVLAKVPVY